MELGILAGLDRLVAGVGLGGLNGRVAEGALGTLLHVAEVNVGLVLLLELVDSVG